MTNSHALFSGIVFISSSFLKDVLLDRDLLIDSIFFFQYLNMPVHSQLLLFLIQNYLLTLLWLGFPCGSAGKESTCNAGDLGSIPGLGRSPGEGNGYPLQYSGLENSMDCIVHGVAKSGTRQSDFHFYFSVVPSHDVSFSYYCFQDFLCLFQQFYNVYLGFV